MKRLAIRTLAVYAGLLLGAFAANAMAAETSAQPIAQPGIEVRNQLESDLASAVQTSSTNILNDVSNTIACAQQSKLYNKTTGTCIGAGTGTDPVASPETGPFTQTWSTPGTYTFNVPDYTTIVMYAWGAGGGGSSGSYVCPPNANPYFYKNCIMYTVTYPQYLSTAITYYGAYLVITPASNGGDTGVMAPTPALAGGGKGAGVAGSPAASGADESKTTGGSAGGAAGTYGSVGGVGGTAFKAFKNGAAGAPVKNTPVTIKVGAGGAPAGNGGTGSPGKVTIYWMQRPQ